MADYKLEITVKKSSKYYRYEQFEYLLFFLFCHADYMKRTKRRTSIVTEIHVFVLV